MQFELFMSTAGKCLRTLPRDVPTRVGGISDYGTTSRVVGRARDGELEANPLD
jgi:hypothetical protein